MKKYFFTMAVIAFFAIGFAASGDSDEVIHENGRDYYKKIPKCYNCGKENPAHYYWQDDHGNIIWHNETGSSNWIRGRYFCTSCLTDPKIIDKLDL